MREASHAAALGPSGAAGARVLSFPIGTPLEEVERQAIHETLRHTKGDKRLAAQLLGIATRTIYRKLKGDKADGDDADDGAALAHDPAERDPVE